MNEPWITIVSLLLVSLGVLAALNLFRIFTADWRQGRREQRARPFRSAPLAAGPAASRGVRRARVTVCGIAAASSAALGQVGGTPGSPSESSQLAPERSFALAAPRLTFSDQPPEQPAPAAASTPLTIATNRPSFDDTASIVQIGHFQLETGYTFTFRNRDGVETQTNNAPEILVRIPLLEDRLEVQVGTSGYVWSRSDSGSGFESTEGFSDVAIGLRWKIVDEDKWVPRIALQASTTIGAGSDNISNQDVEPTFKFIWSYDLGQGWGLYGNLALAYPSSDGDRFLQGQAGACLTYTINDKWSVYGEYYVFGPNSKGTDAAHYADFGAAYLITPRTQLDGRVGFGLNQEANNLFTGFGISFLF